MILCNKLQLPDMATKLSSRGSYFDLHAKFKLIEMAVYCSTSLIDSSLRLVMLLNTQISQPRFVACSRWGAKFEATQRKINAHQLQVSCSQLSAMV